MLTSQLQALPDRWHGVCWKACQGCWAVSHCKPGGLAACGAEACPGGKFLSPKQKQRVAASATTRAGAGGRSLRNLLSPGNVQNPFQQSV